MTEPNRIQNREPPEPNLSRLEEEARRVLHDYAETLRGIIKTLRQRLLH